MKRLVGIALFAILLAASLILGADARWSGKTGPLVRTYIDGQGRTIYLYEGRSTGHRGDWGWLHIKGKHVEGVWKDGGKVTTFPRTVGASTDAEVQDLIGRALLQVPTKERGRFMYRREVPGTGYKVLVVVEKTGTIITSYPTR